MSDRNHDTVVEVATRPRAGWSGIRIPSGVRNVSFLQRWGRLCIPFSEYWGFPRVKRPRREVDRSSSSVTEVKCSYTCILPVCSRSVDRDNFAFYNVKNIPLSNVTIVIPTGSEDFLACIVLSRVLLITVSVFERYCFQRSITGVAYVTSFNPDIGTSPSLW